MKDSLNSKMDTHGVYGNPQKFPAKYKVSIHRYIWYATIFGFSAIVAVVSCMVYFDCAFGFLGPLQLGGLGSYGKGTVVAYTGKLKELAGVGNYNSSARNMNGETGQHKRPGGAGDNSTGEGIVVDETGQPKKLGNVRDNSTADRIVMDETGQEKQLGNVGDKNSGDEVVDVETGQQKKLGNVGENSTAEGLLGAGTEQQKQLGNVGDNSTAEGIVNAETSQQKQLGKLGDQNSGEEIVVDEIREEKKLGNVGDNSTAEGVVGDETGQQKQLGDVRSSNTGEESVGLKGKKQLSECDLSVGMWVRDETYPIYQSHNCPFMDSGFRCQENGRPDSDYLKWRWKPSDCDLPRFDPRKFLRSIQNKRIVFVGDSIGRNQWESMICMLAEGVSDKTRIYEVNGNPITKHMGFLSFRFVDYNCTIEYYRAPFLVSQGHAPNGSPPGVRMSLKVDTLDYNSKLWANGDIIVFNTGHWWNNEKTVRWGCYFQEGNTVNIEMDIETAFQKSMNTWAQWIRQNVDSERSHVFLRTYSPVHFRAGTWRTGGQCHEETWPNLNSSYWGESWKTRIMREAVQNLQDRKNVQSLNITYSAEMRKDGHPSIYYVDKANGPAPIKRQDCSHWCLPGVPDQWNHLLYSYLIATGYGDLGIRVSRN